MNFKLPVRIAVLSGFILLIGVFVAYRSGAFEGNGVPSATDTIPSRNDTIKADSIRIEKEMMSGSKSVILMNAPLPVDTPEVKTPVQKETKPAKRTIMPGSKSGAIISPEQESTEQDGQKLRMDIMGSSKSAVIIRPEAFDTTKKKD